MGVEDFGGGGLDLAVLQRAGQGPERVGSADASIQSRLPDGPRGQDAEDGDPGRGAESRVDEDGGEEAGSVYVFERGPSGWDEVQKLLASDGQAGDQFGSGRAILGDTLVLGAPYDDDLATDAGAAREQRDRRLIRAIGQQDQ